MKLYTPDYYSEFHCISSQCRHSCCIGWEIGLDRDTLGRYAGVSGSLGQELKESIAREENGTAHFILQGKEERCPFLREDGLCRLILELGESSLSQICADHPRFRNFYEGRTEMGLGLCCEAAAGLIVSREPPFSLTLLSEDDGGEECSPEEERFFSWRQKVLDMVQNRALSFEERLNRLVCRHVRQRLMPENWLDAFRRLEVLDAKWPGLLRSVKNASFHEECALPLEQLLCCLLYRHLSGGLQDGCFTERLHLCILSLEMIYAVACVLEDGIIPGKASLAEAARMFSSEIEYSDQNIDALLCALEN